MIDPSNLLAEQQLIGSLFLAGDPLAKVGAFLKAEHFSEPVYGMIYGICFDLHLASRSITLSGVLALVLPEQAIGDETVQQHLAGLIASVASPMSALAQARTIFDLASRRTAAAIGDELSRTARTGDGNVSPLPMVEDAGQQLFDLGASISELDNGATASSTYMSVVRAAEQRMLTGMSSVRGVRSGLQSLDQKLGGFAPGDFCLLAGRPGMGKSLLALAVARRSAQMGYGVGFLSLEMGGVQVRSRLLADVAHAAGSKIAFSLIDRKLIRPSDVAVLERSAESLDKLPLVLIERGRKLSDLPSHIRACRKELARKGADLNLFIVDYLQLLTPGDRYRGDRVREVGEMSSVLVGMAKNEGIAIIALSQLSRGVEARTDKHPVMSDLRETGNLEQDADVVMFAYREAYYLERPGYVQMSDGDRLNKLIEVQNRMEIIIAKQRQGPPGSVEIWVDMALNSVADLQR